MRIIYHLVPQAVWEQAPPGPYRDSSLAEEGYLHCSNPEQVEAVANRFFASVDHLLVLHLNADRLGGLVVDEAPSLPPTDPFAGQLFPHIYGAIDRIAIVAVTALERDEFGTWHLP